VILNLDKNDFPFDKIDEKNRRKLKIYPIIVYTDLFFSLDGVGHYLNGLFDDAIQEFRTDVGFQINDLILISLQTVFDIINKVEKREYTFAQLCDLYYRKLTRQEKRGQNPTAEVHLRKQYRGFDTTMSNILFVPDASKTLVNQITDALDDK